MLATPLYNMLMYVYLRNMSSLINARVHMCVCVIIIKKENVEGTFLNGLRVDFSRSLKGKIIYIVP